MKFKTSQLFISNEHSYGWNYVKNPIEIWIGEKVLVVDHTNGARLETYVIEGKKESGIIGMNGAAARLMAVGDKISIMAFALSDEPIKAKKILCTEDNKVDKFFPK